MNYKTFGRTGWQVSDIGYGMWGMAGWTGSDDEESLASLQRAVDLGCNFFDTAWNYGAGHSERLLGQLLKQNPDKKLYVATKIPPKNFGYPARPEYTLDDTFPPEHIEEYLYKSLENLGVSSVDLIQLHTWNDHWLEDDRWLKKLQELREQKLFSAVGISLNRWQPWNGLKAVLSGVVDSVQVVYNIFDQNPEDELFPACRENNVAVIARVPFDEGSLTGVLTKDTTFPEGDWRNTYFAPENLIPTVERVEKLKEILPEGMTLPEMALRFIISNETVSTTIPGMRRVRHVEENIAASDKGKLSDELLEELKNHRWVRTLKL
jgi:Predicted oxidoreductases (related to aryl-alcohol dehydrogenases)